MSELYYSSSDDDYKLLRVTQDSEIYIYSLKSDSWRKVDTTKDFRTIPYCISEHWKPCSYPMNDKLYFLKEVEGETQSSRSYSIIRFDTKSEKFTKIATPSFKKINIACLIFVILRGCIHLCVTYDDSKGHHMETCLMFGLWQMNGDGEWIKAVSFCQKLCIQVTQPLHLMRNGNWLLNSETEGYSYKIDLEKNIKHISCSYTTDNMAICPRGKFVEAFASPNRQIK